MKNTGDEMYPRAFPWQLKILKLFPILARYTAFRDSVKEPRAPVQLPLVCLVVGPLSPLPLHSSCSSLTFSSAIFPINADVSLNSSVGYSTFEQLAMYHDEQLKTPRGVAIHTGSSSRLRLVMDPRYP